MKQTVLPSNDQIGRLKRELNLLLWTNDAPEIPADTSLVVAPETKIENVAVNIQSVAHALITTELFLRRGFTVATRCGAAFMIERSPDGRRENDMFKQLPEHWWLTLADHGVVDLSLRGMNEHPVIYCNQSLGGRWRVQFGEVQKKLDTFMEAKEQGCFYFTFKKKAVTETELANEMLRGFAPAQKIGIPLYFRKVLEHCDKVLAGIAETLSGLPQREAWEKLAR